MQHRERSFPAGQILLLECIYLLKESVFVFLCKRGLVVRFVLFGSMGEHVPLHRSFGRSIKPFPCLREEQPAVGQVRLGQIQMMRQITTAFLYRRKQGADTLCFGINQVVCNRRTFIVQKTFSPRKIFCGLNLICRMNAPGELVKTVQQQNTSKGT